MPIEAELTTRPARSRLLVAAAVVLGAVGLLRLVATIVFSFMTEPEDGGVATGQDWVYAGWSAVMALSLLAAAVGLRTGARRAVAVAAGVLAADLVFTVVKALVYEEPEAVVFGVVDLGILVLLALVRRRA